ncbi:MAG TPA: PadR family transcriptional regulator [Streptosporangiaceae bacterium]|nr:PadR family transcriptional regulator [Streptosporangiaceae bacterium]
MPRDALANPVALAALGALLERPMHPYQLAAVLADRGVPVNRGSLYDTVDAMARAGWIEPLPAERAGARPQRTPYALTGTGRAALTERLDAQIRVPRREFPEFLGAVSHLGVLGPKRAADALRERGERLAATIADYQRRLDRALEGGSVPRLFVIEAEYARAMARAERDWVLGLADEVASGRLAWPRRRPHAKERQP